MRGLARERRMHGFDATRPFRLTLYADGELALTDGAHDVMLFSDAGKAVRFAEEDVRPMGRTARGVRGMSLEDGQQVIALLVAENEQQSVLTATENGYGKRTPITEYTRHGRGTQGMIAIQYSERNGKLVAAQLVSVEDEIMLITTGGVLIRTRVSEIRELGLAQFLRDEVRALDALHVVRAQQRLAVVHRAVDRLPQRVFVRDPVGLR